MKMSIKQAYVSLPNTDDSAYPNMQVVYNKKPTDVVRLAPYGLDTNPPKDAWCLLLSSQGQESVKFGIASDFLNRKKGLQEGEVCLYNTLTKSFVFLKKNGDVAVDAKENVEVTATGEIDLTAPTIKLNGNVEFTGSSIKHNGKEVGENHGHTQGNDSDGDTEEDISGVK